MEAEEEKRPPQIVFPGDNRIRINPTNVQPYFWVGRLDIEFPSGDGGHGTGTLVAPNKVLTCAHNLYQKKYGGHAKAITFSLAQNSNEFPYGTVGAVRTNVPETFIRYCPLPPNQQGNVRDYTNYLYDYGMVTLGAMLEPAGILYPEIRVASDESLNNIHCDITGYPGDKPSGTMWNGAGPINSISEEFLFYQVSTYNGQSGSAVRCQFPDIPPPGMTWIVGIHVAGSTDLNSNFAVRINESVFDEISQWM